MILRAHHMLCILGFRGRGYSNAFVDNMSQIVGALHFFPETAVGITDRPDDICHFCPFFGDKGCTKRGPESEERARKRDQDVLDKLSLTAGSSLTWSHVLQNICDLTSREDMKTICHDCEWLLLDFCMQGFETLKKSKSRSRNKGMTRV